MQVTSSGLPSAGMVYSTVSSVGSVCWVSEGSTVSVSSAGSASFPPRLLTTSAMRAATSTTTNATARAIFPGVAFMPGLISAPASPEGFSSFSSGSVPEGSSSAPSPAGLLSSADSFSAAMVSSSGCSEAPFASGRGSSAWGTVSSTEISGFISPGFFSCSSIKTSFSIKWNQHLHSIA